MLTPERVGEGEAGGELFGLNQEAGAIGDPLICGSHVSSSQFSIVRL